MIKNNKELEMTQDIVVRYYTSTMGELVLGTYQNKICLCDWRYRKMRDAIDQRIQTHLSAAYRLGDSPLLHRLCAQLDAYFAGNLIQFDVPLLLAGSTFQCSVWNALHTIPYGKTTSYLALSQTLGNEKAIRAVAAANGANALALLVPCHRVVGSNGKLIGYAGGLRAKQQLLALEAPDTLLQLDLFGEQPDGM